MKDICRADFYLDMNEEMCTSFGELFEGKADLKRAVTMGVLMFSLPLAVVLCMVFTGTHKLLWLALAVSIYGVFYWYLVYYVRGYRACKEAAMYARDGRIGYNIFHVERSGDKLLTLRGAGHRYLMDRTSGMERYEVGELIEVACYDVYGIVVERRSKLNEDEPK